MMYRNLLRQSTQAYRQAIPCNNDQPLQITFRHLLGRSASTSTTITQAGSPARRKFLMIASGAFGFTLAIPAIYKSLVEPAKSGDKPGDGNVEPDLMITSSNEYVEAAKITAIQISRRIFGPNPIPGKRLVLFQYQTCPFCCKVRAFLQYYGIPFDVVEVNPVMRQQLRFSKYRKVPILFVLNDKQQAADNGEEMALQLNDSSTIISILATYLTRRAMDNKISKGKDAQVELAKRVDDELEEIASLYKNLTIKTSIGKLEPQGIVNKYFLMFGDLLSSQQYKKLEQHMLNERRWRKWADDHLVHMLSPNIYRSPKEALESFRYFSKVGEWEHNFSEFERQVVIYVGAAAMYLVGKRLKRKHNLKDNVRDSLYDACTQFIRKIRKTNEPYLGGQQPALSDLAIYGVLNSIEGCQAFSDLIEQNKQIDAYYKLMQKQIQSHAGVHRNLLPEH